MVANTDTYNPCVTQVLSIIIPTLNEAKAIVPMLSSLQRFRERGHEVIVVDGDSDDNTVHLAKKLADHAITWDRGRSRQMNAGAAIAKGNVLLFLHADTWLPSEADTYVIYELERSTCVWGHFDVRLSGTHPLFRVIEALMNLRSRMSDIATGDQAMFIRRDVFFQIGGFPDIDLMEDITMSRRLKCYGPPLCLRQRVTTSSRRWEQHGILRTVVKMWYLRLVYAAGADARDLARRYQRG